MSDPGSSSLRLATDVLERFVREVAQAIADRPVGVRVRTSWDGLLRGHVDELHLDLSGIATSGLLVDDVTVSATELRLRPGLPARLQATRVTTTGRVSAASVNRWLRTDLGPFEIELTEEGVGLRTGVAGFTVNRVAADLAVDGRWLRLRPRRAQVMGVGFTNVPGVLRGYLPLPPLPRGARLEEVVHGDGELQVTFDFGELDEPVDLGLAERLRRRFRLTPLEPGESPPPA